MCSVQFSHLVISDSLWPHELQHTRLPCPSLSPGDCWLMSVESVMPSHHLILCCPLLHCPSIFPRIRAFSSESTLCIRWPKYRRFSFSISPSNEYLGMISFRLTGWPPWSPRDSQEFSPTPQFKSISSSVLSFLHHPALTSLHDHWKNHSLD